MLIKILLILCFFNLVVASELTLCEYGSVGMFGLVLIICLMRKSEKKSAVSPMKSHLKFLILGSG